MKVVFVLLVVCCSLVAASSPDALTEEMPEIAPHDFGDEYTSLLELGVHQDDAIATYLPDSGPYDNPATDTTPTKTIPSSPTCTIRGQTIFEIRKMRADAKQIGMSIMYEIQTMEKRKAYIEAMSAYLNDRIRELNKVKHDLAAEQKWIQVSNARIAELAQKEKLIKLQDVMSCIKTEQERLSGEGASKAESITSLQSQATELEQNISKIRTKMNTITQADSTQHHGAAGAAGGAGGAAGAPPAAGGAPAAAPPAAS